MKREDFKRYQPLFCFVVFAVLGLGYYQEHVGRVQPKDEFPFPAAEQLQLAELRVPGGSHSIAGRIFDAQGRPAPEVQISLQLRERSEAAAEPLLWTLSDRDGRYALQGLEALEYTVNLYLSGVPISAGRRSVRPPLDGMCDFTLSAPAPRVEEIPEVRRAPLSGSIYLPAGRLLSEHPLEGYAVVARPLSSNDEMTGAVTRQASVNRIGLFEFEGLTLGDYQLELMPPWGAGGTWPVLGSLLFKHRAGDQAQNVILELRAGAVTGVVLDVESKPLQGAVVLLWPKHAPTHVWPLSQTSSAGRVTIIDLPAGSYVARVRAGSAASEIHIEVHEGITSGLSFDALDIEQKRGGD